METTPAKTCCPNCGHEFDPKTSNQPAPPKNAPFTPIKQLPLNRPVSSSTTTIIVVTAALLILVFLGTVLYRSVQQRTVSSTLTKPTDTTASSSIADADTTKKDTTVTAVTTNTDVKKENWKYDSTENAMISGKDYFAYVTANSELSLSAPYDGYNTATVVIQKRGKKSSVYLKMDKGQFISGVYGTSITVRFDDNHAVMYKCSAPADYSTNVLFINPASKFIDKMKKAKKMLIAATVYQDGEQTMDFTVNNLKWNH